MSITTEVTQKVESKVIREDTLYQSKTYSGLIWLSFMHGTTMGMLCVASPGGMAARVGAYRRADDMCDVVVPFYGSVTINAD